jgi:hypothetical protein
MFPRITRVRHVKDYELELGFSDGTVAQLDFRGRIVGRDGVFLPLENVDFFSQVTVDSEAGTVAWPNGVDFCPDVLYADATGRAITELGAELEVA